MNSMMYIDTYKIKDENGKGVWEIIFPIEDKILNEAEKRMIKWRQRGVNVQEMLRTEEEFASSAYEALKQAYATLEKRDANKDF